MKHLLLPTLYCLLSTFFLAGCEDDSLRLATDAAFPPYGFVRDGEIVGVDIEICRAVANRLGKELKVRTFDFKDLLPAVTSEKVDLGAAGLTITEKRREQVDFSVPYTKTGLVIIHSKNGSITSAQACKGRTVGVKGNTTSETYVLEQLHQEPVRFKSVPEAVAALKSGRVNCVIADVGPARTCIKGAPDLELTTFITSEEYGIAVPKNHPKLLKAVDETIAELVAKGQIQKWIDEYGQK